MAITIHRLNLIENENDDRYHVKIKNTVFPHTRASWSSQPGARCSTRMKSHFPEPFQALSSIPLN
ncbi:hypothetical protein [Paraburkholderia flagellata]|uniref:hypothetical protein n=1 Tax=Paraburkholderia flagellata TaxID=2883241 RepID=UPI001F30A9BF|nr:hypothetical protein [Paraburkholderia flagellata]